MSKADTNDRIAQLEQQVASLAHALQVTNAKLDYIGRTLNLIEDNSPSTPGHKQIMSSAQRTETGLGAILHGNSSFL